MRTIAVVVFVLGAGFAWGGLLGSWRYGRGLGDRALRFFRLSLRYGLVTAAVGVALVVITGSPTPGTRRLPAWNASP